MCRVRSSEVQNDVCRKMLAIRERAVAKFSTLEKRIKLNLANWLQTARSDCSAVTVCSDCLAVVNRLCIQRIPNRISIVKCACLSTWEKFRSNDCSMTAQRLLNGQCSSVLSVELRRINESRESVTMCYIGSWLSWLISLNEFNSGIMSIE